MNPMHRIGTTLATTFCLTALALAQPPGFPGPPPLGVDGPPPLLILVSQRAIQNELKLNAGQLQKINAAWAKQTADMRTAMVQGPDKAMQRMKDLTAESDQAVSALLKAEQERRLKEISYQLQGLLAFREAPVVKEVELTTEQQQEVGIAVELTKTQVSKLFQGGLPNPELMRRKVNDLNKDAAKKFVKKLSDEQQSKWKAMIGKPFTADVPLPPPMALMPPPPNMPGKPGLAPRGQ